MRNRKQNKIKSHFSISLLMAILIILIEVIIIINVSKRNSTIYATTDEIKVEEKKQNEIETKEIVEIGEKFAKEARDKKIERDKKENAKPKTAMYTIKGEQYNVVGYLNIPSLGIEYPILAETSDALLNVSVTKYWGANPNQVGNMVVLGHNYKNSKFFGKLPKIKTGAIIEITDLTGKTLNYEVYDTYVVDPYDNSCTSQLTEGHTEITLITCYYENGAAHATKRFVVKARANLLKY